MKKIYLDVIFYEPGVIEQCIFYNDVNVDILNAEFVPEHFRYIWFKEMTNHKLKNLLIVLPFYGYEVERVRDVFR